MALLLLISGVAGCGNDNSDPASQSDDDAASDDDTADADDDTADDDVDDSTDDDTFPAHYRESCAGGPTLTFDLDATPMVAPFPNDLYTVDDAASPTGRRVHIDSNTARPIGSFATSPLLDFLVGAYNELTGFSLLADLYLPVGAEPDDANLPDALGNPDGPAPSLADPVILMAMGGELGGDLVPLTAKWRAPDLHLTPNVPLREEQTYALVATRVLRPSGAGDCYRASPSMRAVWETWANGGGEASRARYIEALDALDVAGLSPDDVLSISFFTTGRVTGDLAQANTVLNEHAQAGPPTFRDWEVTPDADPALFATAIAAFDMPVFQRADDADLFTVAGAWGFGADGRPVVDHTETIHAYFTLPAPDATPAGEPYPVVMFEHGIFNSKFEMRPPFSTELAAAGFATVGIDAVCHGERLREGVGDIGQVLCFYDVLNPDTWRDNIRESVANLHWLRLALDSLADQDLDQNGIPDLDVTRVYSVGASFGSLLAGSFSALEPKVGAHVLAASGAKLSAVARDGEAAPVFDAVEWLESLIAPDEPVTSFFELLLFGYLQAILDPADSASYVAHTLRDPLPLMDGFAPQVLEAGSAWDDTIGGPPGGWLARAGDWPQVEPIVWDAGVPAVPAPFAGSGYYQFDTDDHTLIFDSGDTGAAARAQIIHFLTTHRDTGTGTIIDPLAE